MTKHKKIMVWTHWDLDGVLCYLLIKWTFPKAIIEYQATTVQSFRNMYTTWLSKNNTEDYDKIFIMDLGVFEDKDLIDLENVFIIDHHIGHDNTTYKKAKTIIKEYDSAGMLAYKLFKKLYNIQLTRAQLHLLLLSNDFDSYKLEHNDSNKLNIIFWDTTNKFEAFIKNFINGFNGFSVQQHNIIKLHDLKLEKYRKESEIFKGTVKIQGKDRCVCAIFATEYINEIADILLNDHSAEIALVVNTKTNHVSYRRAKTSDINLFELAFKLAKGAGHEYSAGSEISENFINFTKTLDKI